MTVKIANNYTVHKQRQQTSIYRKTMTSKIHKIKRFKHYNGNEIDDNKATPIPVASVSPQLSNVRRNLFHNEQYPSYESTVLSRIKTKPTSHRLSRLLRRTSKKTRVIRHRRQTNVNSSNPNLSSTSPVNVSRSTSPAASIANFIHPISPPCIQVKEPLSSKVTRASPTIITNYRHYSSPVNISSMTNNIDASTSSATTTLSSDNSFNYNSNKNSNNNRTLISNVPENCFEPETYRNLYSFNSNQQKKLSLSDPILNQIRKVSQRQILLNSTTTTNQYVSASSLQRPTTNDDEHIQMDNDNEIKRLRSCEEILLKEKMKTISTSQKVSMNENNVEHIEIEQNSSDNFHCTILRENSSHSIFTTSSSINSVVFVFKRNGLYSFFPIMQKMLSLFFKGTVQVFQALPPKTSPVLIFK